MRANAKLEIGKSKMKRAEIWIWMSSQGHLVTGDIQFISNLLKTKEKRCQLIGSYVLEMNCFRLPYVHEQPVYTPCRLLYNVQCVSCSCGEINEVLLKKNNNNKKRILCILQVLCLSQLNSLENQYASRKKVN